MGQVALHVALKRAMQGEGKPAGPGPKARQQGAQAQRAAKPAKAAAKPKKKPSAAAVVRMRSPPDPHMMMSSVTKSQAMQDRQLLLDPVRAANSASTEGTAKTCACLRPGRGC